MHQRNSMPLEPRPPPRRATAHPATVSPVSSCTSRAEFRCDVLGVVGLGITDGWGPTGRAVTPQVLHEQQPGTADDRSGDDLPSRHHLPDSTPLRARVFGNTQIDIRSASRPSTDASEVQDGLVSRPRAIAQPAIRGPEPGSATGRRPRRTAPRAGESRRNDGVVGSTLRAEPQPRADRGCRTRTNPLRAGFKAERTAEGARRLGEVIRPHQPCGAAWASAMANMCA